MGALSYIATRSLAPGHIELEEYSLEIGLTDATRSRDVRKTVHRAANGNTETVYEGAETTWALEFEPTAGADLLQLIEFLDSTASGETFTVWIYGTEAAPISARRSDSGYSPQAFIRTAIKDREPYVMRITVVEYA